MIKKLIKHGNSLALIIERPVLDLLNIEHDTPLEISTDGEILVISPVHSGKRRRKFESALKKINMKYSRSLKKLAE